MYSAQLEMIEDFLPNWRKIDFNWWNLIIIIYIILILYIIIIIYIINKYYFGFPIDF